MFFRKTKTLQEYLKGTKKVVLHGVAFEIKRLNVMDHLEGLNVIQKIHDTYQAKKKDNSLAKIDDLDELKKLQDYCRDILVAGVVSPKLSLKKDGSDGIFVGDIFNDMDLAKELTVEILKLTFKKK